MAAIDPALADTAEFCTHYGVGLDVSANCVVIRGKRGGEALPSRFVLAALPAVEVIEGLARPIE